MERRATSVALASAAQVPMMVASWSRPCEWGTVGVDTKACPCHEKSIREARLATLTLDRYGHLFADELDDVAARLDDAMRDADVVPMWSRADPTLFDSDGQESENGR